MKHINIPLLSLLIITIPTGLIHAQTATSDFIQFSDLTYVQQAPHASKHRPKIYSDPQGQKWVIKNFHNKSDYMVREYIGAKIFKFILDEGTSEIKLVKDLPGHIAAEYMEGFSASIDFVVTSGIKPVGVMELGSYLLSLNKKVENYEELWASMDFIGLHDRSLENQGFIIKKDDSIIAARVDYDFSLSYAMPIRDSLIDYSFVFPHEAPFDNLHSTRATKSLLKHMNQAGWDMNKYYTHLEKISKIPVSELIEIIDSAANTLKHTYPEIFEPATFEILNYYGGSLLDKDNYSYYHCNFDEYINYLKHKVLEQHAHIKYIVEKVNQELAKNEL